MTWSGVECELNDREAKEDSMEEEASAAGSYLMSGKRVGVGEWPAEL